MEPLVRDFHHYLKKVSCLCPKKRTSTSELAEKKFETIERSLKKGASFSRVIAQVDALTELSKDLQDTQSVKKAINLYFSIKTSTILRTSIDGA